MQIVIFQIEFKKMARNDKAKERKNKEVARINHQFNASPMNVC